VAALTLPLAGLRARAAGPGALGRTNVAAATKAEADTQQPVATQATEAESVVQDSRGSINPDALRALGIVRPTGKDVSARIAKAIARRGGAGSKGGVSIQSGQPTVLNAASALSAALITTIGGRDNQFSEVTLIADWDGREDCTADREQKIDDFSFVELEI